MLTSLALHLLAVVTVTNALGNDGPMQQPMPGVHLPKLAGQWYTAFRKAPCSWSGSEKLDNLRPFYQYDGKAAFIIHLTWGTEYCSTVSGKMVFTNTPGVMLYNDGFGDSMSGRYVVIATDYKGFMVVWGCTKVSAFGDRCDDVVITVQTRLPNPSMKTVSRINDALMQRFGISVNELKPVRQTRGGCFAGSKMPPPFKG